MIGLGPIAAAARRGARRRPPPLVHTDALFLDIDGTLLQLAETPDSVDIDPFLGIALVETAAILGGAMALITGRSIRDVDVLFPGLALPCAGQHGCERRSGDGAMNLHASDEKTLDRLRDLFTHFASRHPGVLVEHKGATLALHYRAVPELASHVHRTVQSAMEDVEGWTVEGGKRLVEIRPGGRNKGRAIQDFMSERPFAGRRPVFVGDDRGDEHGFRIVEKAKGVAIKVGNGPTAARYRLPDVEAVRMWIAALVPGPAAP